MKFYLTGEAVLWKQMMKIPHVSLSFLKRATKTMLSKKIKIS